MDARVERLTAVADQVAADWGITLGQRLPSRHSFLAVVGTDAILKVVRPDLADYEHEAEALSFWNGDHAVRLIRRDRARRALLLERARPGHDLSQAAEEVAPSVAIEVGHALWRPAPAGSPFRDVIALNRGWLAGIAGIDPELVAEARTVLDRIEIRTPRLVHGDFHHHNILRRGEEWAVIDPQPALGEPEYDVATLLWNPIGTTPTPDRISRWLAAFGRAGFNPARIRAWAIVRGVVLSVSSSPGRPHAAQLQVVQSLLDPLTITWS